MINLHRNFSKVFIKGLQRSDFEKASQLFCQESCKKNFETEISLENKVFQRKCF